MLTSEGLREGQMWVDTPEGAMARLDGYARQRVERKLSGFPFEVVMGGLCRDGDISFPYPGHYGTTAPLVGLRRDQAEHVAVELLKRLNGGELPTDSAELVDFITGLGR